MNIETRIIVATQLVSIRDCERDIGDAHITRSLGREGALLHAIAMSTAALVVNIPPLRSGLVTLKADRDEPDRLTTSVVDHIFSKKNQSRAHHRQSRRHR